MRKKGTAGKIAMTLMFTMTLLAGCSGNNANQGSGNVTTNNAEGNAVKESDTSPITFSFYSVGANWNNMQDDVGKEITKMTGVTLDAETEVGGSAQKLALMATSGQYPDLLSATGDLNKFVDAGAMIDLTDLIDQYAPNIKKLFGDQFKRLRYSNEDRAIYAIPTYSAVDGKNFNAGGGFELQHRAVKEAGYPSIKTLQDYEDVIKSYLEKHPTDDKGNKNIGLSLNGDDWHMYITVTNPAAETTGKSGDGEYYINPKTNEAIYHFRTEGEKEYFKWLNHMNNVGLLDKDSFVQKNDEYLAKIASGRVIGLTDADWGYADGERVLKKDSKLDQTYGHYPVMVSDKYKDNRLQSTGFMAGWGIGITKECKDPVRAIKFLDFLASEQGQILLNWGIEGKHYTMQDGKRIVPKDVQNRVVNDNTAFIKESGIGLYTNIGAHYGDGVIDSSGNYYTKNFPELIVNNYTEADKQTLQAYGVTTWADLFTSEDDLPVKAWGAAWNIPVPTEDETNILAVKMKDISWKRVPQAILAKPEEFDQIWDEYQQELINAGVEKMEARFTKYLQDRVKLWNE